VTAPLKPPLKPENCWVALVHHPVYDKHHRVVATALTNLDLHDIARSTRTYGCAGFFIVHPVAAQRELAARIASHWMGEGAEKNDFRRQAIERIQVVSSLEEARSHVQKVAGRPPYLVATAARDASGGVAYQALAHSGPLVLVLGTGWGLSDELMAGCDARLQPIQAASDYNHLSVRSACAIILDRLYGDHSNYATS
jgi:hypothetical protein